jgi:hypothetical protein
MVVKPKKKGRRLEMRMFAGRDGRSRLVFRTRNGVFHVFMEVEAKEAARKWGATREGNSRQMQQSVW